MRIIVLDPDSSDPTWGMADEAMTLDLNEEQWNNLLEGLVTAADIIEADAWRCMHGRKREDMCERCHAE